MSGLFSRQMGNEKKEQKEHFNVKIASYDSLHTIPRVVDLDSDNIENLINQTAEKVYQFSREKGGKIPFIVINEIIENLIHASFEEATISIMPDGNRICIADQGPGITDKRKASLPGFSSASKDMKKYIRGVGSGLPIANESLTLIGGNLTIEDNLKKGVVITLNMHCQEEQDGRDDMRPNSSLRHYASEKKEKEDYSYMETEDKIGENQEKVNKEREKTDEKDEIYRIDERMTPRQRKVFILIGEMGEAGPSTVAEELNLSLSTAYRDLVALEDEGLLECVEGGKRRLSRKGIKYLSTIFE